jgi:hypothetical protein
MTLRWHQAHDGSPAFTAMDNGQYLVGQVARYDSVDGNGPGWLGFVRGHRVTERACATAEHAQRAVEGAAP